MDRCFGAWVRRCGGYYLCAALLLVCVACAKPLVRASAKLMEPTARIFTADPNQTYYAVRWALSTRGYPVAFENLPAGLITTAWVPTKIDSHAITPFDRPDYGVTPSYHQLEIKIVPEGGQTRVEVVSRLKSVLAHVQSTGREEAAVLAEVGHFLRSSDAGVTNVGIEE